jgi:hypothetical protein
MSEETEGGDDEAEEPMASLPVDTLLSESLLSSAVLLLSVICLLRGAGTGMHARLLGRSIQWSSGSSFGSTSLADVTERREGGWCSSESWYRHSYDTYCDAQKRNS